MIPNKESSFKKESAKVMKHKNKHTPMMRQYFDIKEKHSDCLLFFRLGDFYELFFKDAIEASKALDITLTKRGKGGDGEAIPMCGVPVHAYEAYLARLIRQGYSVAIVDQVETPEEAKKRGAGALVKRDVVRIVTPGTLTEDSLLQSGEHNYLACISPSMKDVLSVAWVDISTGQFFIEDSKKKGLISILARLQPKEVLVPESIYQDDFLGELWQQWNNKVKILPNVRFNKQSAEEQIEKVFQVSSIQGLGEFSQERIQASGALLDYLHLTQQGEMPRLEKPKILEASNFVQMDAATFKSLELVQTQQGKRKGSFFDCLNKTVTGSGERLLATRVSLPFRDKESIKKRQEIISYMINGKGIVEELRGFLEKTVDIQRILSRISLGRGGPRDLGGLKGTLAYIKGIKNFLEQQHEEKKPNLLQEKLTKALDGFDDLYFLLNQSLREELPLLPREGGFIKEGYNEKLDHFKDLKKTAYKKIQDLQKTYSLETGVSNLKIKHNNMLGYYIETTSLNAKKLQESEVFVHRQTLANNMRFTTRELVELDQDLNQADEQGLRIELDILEYLSKSILEYRQFLIIASRALAELDVLSSFSYLAKKRGYVCPEIEESGVLDIEKGRHPVVELSQVEEKAFIPNDCLLEEKGNVWLITGPNMAGKSTFLRQNALIIIMAQIGCFVPAKRAKIGLVDRIFSRVGASDDLAKGQSTFMVEMIETALILNQASEKAFVILDEVGRGTATYDGLSIAWACLEHLHDKNKCRCLFATHYHELTELETNLSRLQSYTVKIREWEDKVIFLHQIVKGKAGRSYGIHVAKLAGIPESVILRAKSLLENFEKKKRGTEHKKINQPLLFPTDVPIKSFKEKKAIKFYEDLQSLNLENMTAKQALDWLFKTKEDPKE